jgi:hypothetical protein
MIFFVGEVEKQLFMGITVDYFGLKGRKLLDVWEFSAARRRGTSIRFVFSLGSLVLFQ